MDSNRAYERARAGTHIGVIVCSLRALLFLLFMLNGFGSYSQNKTQYDLNDPRNPDCPCHKYQKLADEEYQKQQQGHFSNLQDSNPSQAKQESKNPDDAGSRKLNKDHDHETVTVSSGSSSTRYKKKRPGTWIIKKMNRARLKYSRIKKQRPDYSVCYKW